LPARRDGQLTEGAMPRADFIEGAWRLLETLQQVEAMPLDPRSTAGAITCQALF